MLSFFYNFVAEQIDQPELLIGSPVQQIVYVFNNFLRIDFSAHWFAPFSFGCAWVMASQYSRHAQKARRRKSKWHTEIIHRLCGDFLIGEVDLNNHRKRNYTRRCIIAYYRAGRACASGDFRQFPGRIRALHHLQ